MAKNIYTLTGPTGVGKSYLAKYCSKIMSNDGKRVALIDASDNMGLYYNLCFSEYESKTQALKELEAGKNKALAYGNIDIFTNKPTTPQPSFEKLKDSIEILANDYDAVLVDANYSAALQLASISKYFLVQDYRRESAMKNQQSFLLPLVLQFGECNMPQVSIIYNKAVRCKMKHSEIEQYLMMVKHDDRHLQLLLKAEDYCVPFMIENYISDLNNMADGTLEINRMTPDVKKELLKLCSSMVSMRKTNKVIA